MNIRKPVDYNTMYAELNEIPSKNLSQMEEIHAIGKAICKRSEKGAAVMAAEYLQTNYPDRTGFSPRNVRRMRDFYRTYENDETLLRLAMKIGWTLNVVIMEAELTRAERKWYLEQAQIRKWSKAQLSDALREDAYRSEPTVENECLRKHSTRRWAKMLIGENFEYIHTNNWRFGAHSLCHWIILIVPKVNAFFH